MRFIFLWLIFFTGTFFSRNPFFAPNFQLNVLAHGLKPKPFILIIQNKSYMVYNINDKLNNLFTIKDINKNNYTLVDDYGKEYIYNFA